MIVLTNFSCYTLKVCHILTTMTPVYDCTQNCFESDVQQRLHSFICLHVCVSVVVRSCKGCRPTGCCIIHLSPYELIILQSSRVYLLLGFVEDLYCLSC